MQMYKVIIPWIFVFQLRVDGYKWSTPFSICNEGMMRISLEKDSGDDQMQLRVQVRSGTKRSQYEVIFRPNSLSSPYRLLYILTYFSYPAFPVCSCYFEVL